ncbi:hypothetical protein MP228_000100 [Amoeboaphelidium protococcarum]|nr:hypothetical protein MP228_000100 [Amoeboaphelidium protococcarum]
MGLPKTVIGLSAAVLGNAITGTAQTLQKYGILQVESLKQQQSRFSNKFWLIGLGLNYIGEVIGSYVAISYCQPALVTPLGIINVVVNAISADKMLNEKLETGAIYAYIWIAFGVLSIMLGVPSQQVETLEDLMSGGRFIQILALFVIVALIQAYRLYRLRLRDITNCVTTTALFGTSGLLCSKALTIVLQHQSSSLSSQSQQSSFADSESALILDKHYFAGIAIALIIALAISQELSRQYALTHVRVSRFQPVLYATFVSLSVLSNVAVYGLFESKKEVVNFIALFAIGSLCILEGCGSLLALDNAASQSALKTM